MWNTIWAVLYPIAPPIVIVMVVWLLLQTWKAEVMARHRQNGLSIRWTRFLVGSALVLVCVGIYVARYWIGN